jgi:hypothetical protein
LFTPPFLEEVRQVEPFAIAFLRLGELSRKTQLP